MNYNLYKGDCLKVMDELIQQRIKVDAIITDPPYGVSRCKWDSIIPFDKMWERLNKLIKDNGAIALFGIEPFSSKLRISNLEYYKYDWVWFKERGTDFLNANKKPLSSFENIMIFYRNLPTYNPQKTQGLPYDKGIAKRDKMQVYGKVAKDKIIKSEDGKRFPLNVLSFPKVNTAISVHPTQKPVPLMEYLIKTYTNENETILDFTMGSGTTGVACMNTNRNFIGIELDKKYFEIAEKRIKEAKETIFDMV